MIQTLVRFWELDSPLLQYKKDIASQNGEDGIIERIFELMPPENKYCVEFGAWDGKHLSNCYNLLTNKNWSGMMIEASAEKFPVLRKTYEGNDKVRPVNRLVDFEGANTLDNIFDQYDVPKNIGLLSIDIDGNDYYILESLKKYSADLIVIEFNPTIPNDVIFVQDKSFEINQGCSLLALIVLAKERGYELAVCTACNAFFVKKEKLSLLGVTDNFIYKMFAPHQDGRIFQGYDNTIHVVGMNKLNWHEGPTAYVSSEDFQVLPKNARRFADAQRK